MVDLTEHQNIFHGHQICYICLQAFGTEHLLARHKCESETVAYKIQAEIIDLTQPANTLKEHTFGKKFAFIEFLLEKCTSFS